MFTGLDMCNKYKNKDKSISKKKQKKKKTVIRTNQSLFEKIDLTDGSTSNEFGEEWGQGVEGRVGLGVLNQLTIQIMVMKTNLEIRQD